MAIDFTTNFFQGVLGVTSTVRANQMLSKTASRQSALFRQGAELQAQSIIQGGEVAAQGALLTAAGLRESIQGLSGALGFNLEQEKINTKRRLSAISTDFQRTIGKQLTQTAASGIALTSKSALMLQTEAANIFTNQILTTKIDAENNRRIQVYETRLRQTQLENEARGAEFRAAAERVMASNRAAEVRFQGEVAAINAQQSARSQMRNPINSLLSSLLG